MNFIWNTKKVKTVVSTPEGRVQLEMTPKTIVDAPNRHQMETILSALCTCVSELVRIQEEQAARIQGMMNRSKTEDESHPSGLG